MHFAGELIFGHKCPVMDHDCPVKDEETHLFKITSQYIASDMSTTLTQRIAGGKSVKDCLAIAGDSNSHRK